MTTPRFSRFSPHLIPAEHLERLVVGRELLIRQFVDSAVGTVSEGGARYELLVGPRGAGKSHVLAIVAHRLRQHPAMEGRAVIAQLDEEEHVASLLDLLARLLRILPAEPGLPDPRVQALSLRRTPGAEGENLAIRLIAERLSGRALVLVAENLDRIFSALELTGQKKLRSILQEQGNWSVLAGSQTSGPAFLQRDRPFYRMFILRTLDPLDPHQCRVMLHRLAEAHDRIELAAKLDTPEGLARVRAIHHLTGGSPRAMALIFPYLTTTTLDELTEAFFHLADELTPYYQEQMRARSPGQQAILEHLAESWRPMSVTELSEATFSAQGSTAGQLRHLHNDQLTSRLSLGRESFYEIADPMWRIARAVKRPEGAPAMFVRFLRFWHTREEIEAQMEIDPDPVDREVWQMALESVLEEGIDGIWSQTIKQEIQSCWRADIDRAIVLSEHFYEKNPGIDSAWHLLYSLYLKQDVTIYRERVSETLPRFGYPIAIAVMTTDNNPYSLLDPFRLAQIRKCVQSVPLNSRARITADLLLIKDGESSSELLDECAERISNNKHGDPTTNLLFPDLLFKLFKRGDVSRFILVSNSVPEKLWTIRDRYAYVTVLGYAGEIDLAFKKMEQFIQNIPDPHDRISFEATTSLQLGGPKAFQNVSRLVMENPDDIGLKLMLFSLTSSHIDNYNLLEMILSWLSLKPTNQDTIPILKISLAQLYLLSGSYSQAATHARNIDLSNLNLSLSLVTSYGKVHVNITEKALQIWSSLLLVRSSSDLRKAADKLLEGSLLNLSYALSHTIDSMDLLPLQLRIQPETTPMFIAWLVRAMADEARGLPAPKRLAHLLGESPSDDLVSAITTALWNVTLAEAVHERPLAPVLALLDVVRRIAPERTPVELIEAVAELPGNLRPYARLAAPEREAIRQALARMGTPGRTILDRLPEETTA